MSRTAVPKSGNYAIVGTVATISTSGPFLPPILPRKIAAFRTKALQDTPPHKTLECLLTTKQREARSRGRNSAIFMLEESTDEELSDDDGVRVMRSPNPYAIPRQVPVLRHQDLLRYLDGELDKINPNPPKVMERIGESVPSVAQATVQPFPTLLASALDTSVPEHKHLKTQRDTDAECPYTPRTTGLLAEAKQIRLKDDWCVMRIDTAREIVNSSIALSIQKPTFVDYCRCVRVMQHYSCELPRWSTVMTREFGDPCYAPPLFLSDIPKSGIWRFYNFSISLSVATKIVQRKEATKGRAMSPSGLLPSADVLAAEFSDPCIDVVDVMHNLYPLCPVGALKVSVGRWRQQMRDEASERTKTRLERITDEEVIKTANIFHLLVGGEACNRVGKDAFLSRMPRGERNVHAQLAAFNTLFDRCSRADFDLSSLPEGARNKSRAGERKGRPSVYSLHRVSMTPEAASLPVTGERYMDLECLANALYPAASKLV